MRALVQLAQRRIWPPVCRSLTPSQSVTERSVQQLTSCQTRLYAYLLMLPGGDPATANDVLQEANLVLWRKADEFVDGTDFSSWACSVARFQVLAYLRDTRRNRLVFDETLVDQWAGEGGLPRWPPTS